MSEWMNSEKEFIKTHTHRDLDGDQRNGTELKLLPILKHMDKPENEMFLGLCT